jgi:hypothetical protein
MKNAPAEKPPETTWKTMAQNKFARTTLLAGTFARKIFAYRYICPDPAGKCLHAKVLRKTRKISRLETVLRENVSLGRSYRKLKLYINMLC